MQRSGPCFTVRRTAVGRTCQLTLAGEWDLAAAGQFERQVEDAFTWPLRWLVIDLAHVTFIDATGARAVLMLHLRCVAEHVELRIVPGPRAVQRVFELTRTDRVLPFAAPRPPEATDAFDRGTAAAITPSHPDRAPRRVAAWRAAVT